MLKPIIVVTGANGQLGMELREYSAVYPQFNFIFLTKAELDIQNEEAVKRYFGRVKPAYCVNCAAYTAVDKAETEQESALKINSEAVAALALACEHNNTKLIHISTDYVFNGKAITPYLETSEVEPVNYYGYTKLKGEEGCRQNNPNCIVIRTSWVYSVYGNNFVKTMLHLMQKRESINVVNDQFGSPTSAADLANSILYIINNAQQIPSFWRSGIYHYSNEGNISWHQFAEAIRLFSGSKCAVNPIPTSGYPTPAKRPAYSVFDKQKIKSVFGVPVHQWEESLKKCILKLQLSAG
jgi:dTDP-4-dehydrorhamnose reductase